MGSFREYTGRGKRGYPAIMDDAQHQLVQKGWINTPTIYGNIRKLEENYDIYTFDIEIGQCISY